MTTRQLVTRILTGIAAIACFVLAVSVWKVLVGSLVVGVIVSALMWWLRYSDPLFAMLRILRFLVGWGVLGFFALILIGGGAPWWQAPLMLLATQIIGPALARVALTTPIPPPTEEEIAAAAERAARTRTPGIFGTAGGVGNSAATFGDAAAVGAVGEHRTAVLLDRLADDGSTSVYHGLRFPGSANADVDHAVVRGSGVVLVDSKLYASGTWGLAPSAEPGKVGLVSSTGTRHENSMPDAAAGFSQRLAPDGGRVATVIVLQGHASIRVDPNMAFHAGVHLCTAADLEATIEHLLSSMGAPRGTTTIYPGVLHAMHTQLKTGIAL